VTSPQLDNATYHLAKCEEHLNRIEQSLRGASVRSDSWRQVVQRGSVVPIDSWRQALQVARAYTTQLGDPAALRQAATDWQTFAKTVSDLASGQVKADRLSALKKDAAWFDLPASDTYPGQFAPLGGNLAKISAYAQAIADALNAQAVVLDQFACRLGAIMLDTSLALYSVVHWANALRWQSTSTDWPVFEVGIAGRKVTATLQGMSQLLEIKGATIDPICAEAWPQPSFAQEHQLSDVLRRALKVLAMTH